MRWNRSFLPVVACSLTVVFIVLHAKSTKDFANIAESEAYESKYRELEEKLDTKGYKTSNEHALRYVTPSLAELGARGILPEKNKHVLMLTRVPGAGAELLVLILQRLQGHNAFKHVRLPAGDDGLLTTLQQDLLVEEITNIIRQEAVPLSFDGDVRFLNFSEFGRQGPTFVSLVRDPLDPQTLWRYRKGGAAALYRGAIPFFCGQDYRCTKRNNDWALERAKANVVRWYPVVGVLNSIEETLGALEIAFPYFFRGAGQIYDTLRPKDNRPIARDVRPLKPRAKNKLMKILAHEVEFYRWIRIRLLNSTSDNG